MSAGHSIKQGLRVEAHGDQAEVGLVQLVVKGGRVRRLTGKKLLYDLGEMSRGRTLEPLQFVAVLGGDTAHQAVALRTLDFEQIAKCILR